MRAQPSDEFGKKPPERLLASDKVVVDEVGDGCDSDLEERIELGEYLWVVLVRSSRP